MENVLLGVRFS